MFNYTRFILRFIKFFHYRLVKYFDYNSNCNYITKVNTPFHIGDVLKNIFYMAPKSLPFAIHLLNLIAIYLLAIYSERDLCKIVCQLKTNVAGTGIKNRNSEGWSRNSPSSFIPNPEQSTTPERLSPYFVKICPLCIFRDLRQYKIPPVHFPKFHIKIFLIDQ